MHEGLRKGYLAAIELGIELRFGADGLRLMPEISQIDDLDVLQTIQKAIKKAETLNEVRSSYLR